MEVDYAKEFLRKLILIGEVRFSSSFDIALLGEALDTCLVGGEETLVEAAIDKAIKLQPHVGRIIQIKALLLAKNNESQNALYLLSLVDHSDDYFLSCIELIGVIHMNNYQFQNGVQTFTALLTQIEDPVSRANILNQRSICYQYLGDYKHAFIDNKNACFDFFHEGDYFNEALLNLKLNLLNNEFIEIKDHVNQLASFSNNILETYHAFGPCIFLMEWAYLNSDLQAITNWMNIIRESDNKEEVQKLENRFAEMKIFLDLINQYKKVQQNIYLVNRMKHDIESQDTTTMQTIKKENWLINQVAEVEKYDKSIATLNLEKENLKKILIEKNEDDFNIILTISN